MSSSRMSNSTFSPTYDDPARSDEESDQYGGSTYSGGGPYARAIDSVSQSGTAKRLSKCSSLLLLQYVIFNVLNIKDVQFCYYTHQINSSKRCCITCIIM